MSKSTFIICAWLLLSGLSSCYDTNNTYGNGLVDSAFRNVVTDTSTVLITSVLIDSLETSGKSLVLAGQYTHPLWGTITSSSYVSYTRPSYLTDIEETVILDSLVLLLSPNGYFVGDTTLYQQFRIHKLEEKIVLHDNGYLYNKDYISYDPLPLATHSYKPKPNDGELIEIRLSDDLGNDLLTRFHNRDNSVSSDFFEDYFKGIAIVPEDSISRSLLAFSVGDTLTSLLLYYHVQDELSSSKELLFTPSTANQFNHISHNREGTLMEPYPSRQVEIPSSVLGNRGVMMCGVGWYTRLEFPHLNNILQQGERVDIESAYLKIYPEPGLYSSYNALPDSIYLYIADENNVVTDAVKDYLGEQVQACVLVRDDTFNENTYYYFDVTDFMQKELGAFGMYKHNLQLVFNSSDYSTTFKNLTFSDQQGRAPIVLQLSYKIYESY